MTKEQIEHIKTELNILKDECIRVLSYFKDLEGYQIENYDIVPDYCVIITDDDNDFYVYCEQIGIVETDSEFCIFNPKYLTYSNKELKDYVFEENLKYYKQLDDCQVEKSDIDSNINKSEIIRILNDCNKTAEEKYEELNRIMNINN